MPNFHELAETLVAAVDRAGIGLTIIAQRGDRAVRVYSSQGLCELTGWTAEELAEITPADLAAPAERPRLAAMRDAILAGQPPPAQVESAIVSKTGEIIPVEISLATVQRDDGMTSVLFLRDLRARRRIEQALHESEARFRSLAEASPDSITVIANGRFVYANPAMAAVLGHDTVAEVLARRLDELLVEPSEFEVMKDRLARLGRGERVPPREYGGRRKDGTVAVMEISATPIQYDGAPAILALGRDTTERRAWHAELMRADRLATLGMLAAGVAHEINNPLTYTLLHLERLALTLPKLVADPVMRQKVETMIAEAREGGDRVRGIVRDLLSVARHDHEASPSDVAAALDTAIKLGGPTIAGRARVERGGGAVPSVLANPARLSQVFLNLVLNAADAFDVEADRNLIAITLSHDGPEVVIEVADNGRGIAPSVLARIFEPLFTTKAVGAGTGLGLSICRSIVTECGGTLTATSEVGVGTQMVVRLPTA